MTAIDALGIATVVCLARGMSEKTARNIGMFFAAMLTFVLVIKILAENNT